MFPFIRIDYAKRYGSPEYYRRVTGSDPDGKCFDMPLNIVARQSRHNDENKHRRYAIRVLARRIVTRRKADRSKFGDPIIKL